MPERFKVVCTMQGAIQVLCFTFISTFDVKTRCCAINVLRALSDRKKISFVQFNCRLFIVMSMRPSCLQVGAVTASSERTPTSFRGP